LILVLRPHQGAGGIDQPAARLHETRGAFQDARLELHQRLEARAGRPPAGVGIAAPGAGAAAWGVDDDPVEARLVALYPRVPLALQRAPLDIVHAGAAQPLPGTLQPIRGDVA